MFDTKITITWLLLAAATACTPLSDDDIGPDPSDEIELDGSEDPRLTAEMRGAEIPSVVFAGPEVEAEQEHIAELRATACEPQAHPGPPDDFVAPAPARGLVEPRFRVEEDQAEASRAAWVEATDEAFDAPRQPSDATLAAQQRYLAETLELAPEARAERKAELLGEP